MEELNEVVEEEVLEEKEDFTEQTALYSKKLKNKIITSVVSYVVIIFTMFFQRYEDFDVALSSGLFLILLLFSGIVTLYAIYYMFSNRFRVSEKSISNYFKKINDFYDVVSIIPLFIASVAVINAFIFSPATVVKTSMEPNYYENDNIVVYHLATNYKRYDVVIVKVGEEDYYIKRIIGLPGETITIKNGEIYIGTGSDEELLGDTTTLKPGAHTYCSVGNNIDTSEECTFVIPEGSYFVLGDNREASIDSRYLGLIKEDELYGKVVLKLYFLN